MNRTAKLSHAMEDLLQVLRESHRSITSDLADTLLSAVDSLRAFVQDLRPSAQGLGNTAMSALKGSSAVAGGA